MKILNVCCVVYFFIQICIFAAAPAYLLPLLISIAAML